MLIPFAPSFQRPIFISVFVTLGAVLLVVTVTVSYKKRWHLRHFLFVVNQRIRRTGRDQALPAYKYDAFILYSGIYFFSFFNDT